MVLLWTHQEKMGLEKEIELLINKKELKLHRKKVFNPEFLKSAPPKGKRCEQVGK